MIATNPIIHFSITMYVLVNNIISVNASVSEAPAFKGIWNNKFKAMEEPIISAKEVDTEAIMAVDKIATE